MHPTSVNMLGSPRESELRQSSYGTQINASISDFVESTFDALTKTLLKKHSTLVRLEIFKHDTLFLIISMRLRGSCFFLIKPDFKKLSCDLR